MELAKMEMHAAPLPPLARPRWRADNETMTRKPARANSGSPPPTVARSILLKMLLMAALAGIAIGAGVGIFVYFQGGPGDEAAAAVSPLKLGDIPFDGARAYKYLKDLCAIGPRRSGSVGMAAQQKMLIAHFQKCGGQVSLQRFRARDPLNGSWVPMANIIVRWNPTATPRILLCGHYDTLPFPMMDPVDPQGRFVGANDNASGVAIMMQLAHDMPKLKNKSGYGVDFVLLDGEEYVFSRDDRFFLGSEYFARKYAEQKPYYRWGVLLDMVGATNLRIPQERSGLMWKDTRPLVSQIWSTAARLGVREFVFQRMRETDFLDDHVMLHDVGGIPCIDVIDFAYPPWHTRGDTPDKCSPLSLAKVGWVIEEWLKTAK